MGAGGRQLRQAAKSPSLLGRQTDAVLSSQLQGLRVHHGLGPHWRECNKWPAHSSWAASEI